eukprot:scaffold16444_cov29-Tisochrysis_lutea.AAC.7
MPWRLEILHDPRQRRNSPYGDSCARHSSNAMEEASRNVQPERPRHTRALPRRLDAQIGFDVPSASEVAPKPPDGRCRNVQHAVP